MSVFIDTSFIISYCDSRDSNNARAIELMKEIEKGKYGAIFLSDYILDETATLLKKYLGKENAGEIIDKLISAAEMLKIEQLDFTRSLELFKRMDKLSFTDCTSIHLMEMRGIEYIATFDSDFSSLVKVLR